MEVVFAETLLYKLTINTDMNKAMNGWMNGGRKDLRNTGMKE